MPSYVSSLRNARMDAVTTAVGLAGSLNFYSSSGTSVPASSSAPIGSCTLLATCPQSSAFAAAASSGLLTANAFTTDSAADATGTCTFARMHTSTGQSVIQFSAGSSVGNEIVLNSASISSGAAVSITSLTILEGNP